MPAWATVVLTLGVALIGVVGTLAGIFVQTRHARAEREAEEHHKRLEKGAAIIAPLQALVLEMNPFGLAFLFDIGAGEDRVKDDYSKSGHRWDDLKLRLLVFGAAHPSDDVSSAVTAAADAIDTLQGANLNFVIAEPDQREERLAEAKKSHELASERIDHLLVRMRAQS